MIESVFSQKYTKRKKEVEMYFAEKRESLIKLGNALELLIPEKLAPLPPPGPPIPITIS